VPRGQVAKDGDTRVAPNGYHYVRREGKWVLKHWIVAEERLGRAIKPNEMVYFVDGDKTNFKPSNIQIRIKKTSSMRKQVALIEDRIRELLAKRDLLLKQIKRREEGEIGS
jgi:hypothetical protein